MSKEKVAFKRAVEAALLQLGVLELRFTGSDSAARWDFQFQHDSEIWPLYLIAPNWSLAPLPYLHWAAPEPVWGWPHTGADGAICAFDRHGLDYDADDHEAVLRSLIDKSLQMLARHHAMNPAERLNTFADELEGYADYIGIPSLPLYRPLGDCQRIHAGVVHNKKGHSTIVSVNDCDKPTDSTQRQSLLVVDVNISHLPPLTVMLDNVWWQRLCDALPQNSRQRLIGARGCGAILRVPNRFGYAHILLHWGTRERAQGIKVFRLATAFREHLNRRVGQASLQHRVAIVGLGAVGARVAEHLALAGVDHLTLVDPEDLSADNLGRHVLSRDFVGFNKAHSLALHLCSRMPGINIRHFPETLDGWLRTAQPNEFDVLVLATGDPASERMLLRRAWRESWKCKLVSTFVEAANLGGHAILMQPGEAGCLECLYETEDPETMGLFRTSMLAPGQSPAQEVSSCGTFVPYSCVSATRTALLATELALPNAECGYQRWAGSDVNAKIFFLRPSNFWRALSGGRVKQFVPRQSYVRRDCSCCGN